jgi:hypothetical protein
MPTLTEEQFDALSVPYDVSFAGYVHTALEEADPATNAALAVYLTEMAEEVFFYKQKNIPLIGTKLLGLQHNRTVNQLDMNYITLQGAAMRRELTYPNVDFHVNRFLTKVQGTTLSNSMIACLPPVIEACLQVVTEARSSGAVSGPIWNDIQALSTYVYAHNRAVFAHLQARERDSRHNVNEYRRVYDVQESKEHLMLQDLIDNQNETFRVFAAFVWLADQNTDYTRADVATLTELSEEEVEAAETWLFNNAFLYQDDDASHYPVEEILFGGFTSEDAVGYLNTTAFFERDEVVDTLNWREAVLYATLQQKAVQEGHNILQVGTRELATEAFRGYYTSNSGSVPEILSSLIDAGLVTRDTSVRPYRYTLTLIEDPQTVLAAVPEDQVEKVEDILNRDPHGVAFGSQEPNVPNPPLHEDPKLEVRYEAREEDNGPQWWECLEESGTDLEEFATDTSIREANANPTAGVTEEAHQYSMEEIVRAEEEQEKANQKFQSFYDRLIRGQLAVLSPDAAEKALTTGNVRFEYDEKDGKTVISFELDESKARF